MTLGLYIAASIIKSVLDPAQLQEYGNVIGPAGSGQGWANRSNLFYTEEPPNAYNTVPGETAGYFYIIGFGSNGLPLYRQPPKVVSFVNGEGVRITTLVPGGSSDVPPPIGPIIPPPPPPPVTTYTVETLPATAGGGQVIASTVTSSDSGDTATLYWRYEGDAHPNYFSDNQIKGSLTLSGGSGSWSSTLVWPKLRSGTMSVCLYSDSGYSRRVAINKVQLKAASYTINTTPNPSEAGAELETTVNARYTPSGSTLYWKYEGIDPQYVAGGQLSGAFTISGDSGSFVNYLANQIPTKIDFTVNIFDDSGYTHLVASEDLTVNADPTYSLTTAPTDANEGDKVISKVATTNVDDGTVLYWEYQNVTSDYFKDGLLSGSITIETKKASWSSTVADVVSGDATVTVNVYTDEAKTNLVSTDTFTITKELIPTYTLVSNPDTLDADDTLSNTVNTQHVDDGTTIYWEYSGTGLTPQFFTDNLTFGTLTINNNTASWSSTLESVIPLNVTMGIRIYPDSSKTKILGHQTVTLNKTIIPTYSLISSPNNLTDGQVWTNSITTEHVANGVQLFWRYESPSVDLGPYIEGSLQGSVTIQNDAASWDGQVTNPVPAGVDFTVEVYTDAGMTTKVASAAVSISKTPVSAFTWSANQTQLSDGGSVTYTITATPPPTTPIVIYYKCTGIDQTYLSDPISGPIQWDAFVPNIGLTLTAADPLPGDASMVNRLYSDSGFSEPITNQITVELVADIPPTYNLSIDPSPAFAGYVLTFNGQTTNVSAGTTLFWSFSGTGISSSFFEDGQLTGSRTVNNDGSFSWTTKLKNPIPRDTTLYANVYTDSERTQRVVTAGVNIQNVVPTYSLSSNKSSISDNVTFTNTVVTSNVVEGSALWYKYSGTNLTPNYFIDGKLDGFFQINNQTGSWSSTLSAAVSENITMTIELYTDKELTQRVGNSVTIDITQNPIIQGYYLNADRSFVKPGDTVNYTLKLPNPSPPDGETLYWTMDGLDEGDPMLTDQTYDGEIFSSEGNTEITLAKTFRKPVPYSSIGQIRFSELSDGRNPVNLPLLVNVSSQYDSPNGVYLSSTAINAGDSIIIQIVDTSRPNTTIWWSLAGDNVVTGCFADGQLSGSVSLDENGEGSFSLDSVETFPIADFFYEVRLKFFTANDFATAIYNQSGYYFYMHASPGYVPLLTSASDLNNYYDLGGYWEEVGGTAGPNNVGVDPNLNMSQVMVLKDAVDKFILRVRAAFDPTANRLWNLDAFGNAAGQFFVEDTLGSSLNPNTGNEWGKDGAANSAAKAKNCCYHARNTFDPHLFIVSLGGDEGEGDYDNWGVIWNGTPTEVEQAAIDVANFVFAVGADGVEFSMWRPTTPSQTWDGAKFSAFVQVLHDKLVQINPVKPYSIGLAINARLTTADTNDTPAFMAAASAQYVDDVIVKNYNIPSSWGQNPIDLNDPNAGSFFHPSNPFWSLREIKEYVLAGVEPTLIGTTVSTFAENGNQNPIDTTLSGYGNIVRATTADRDDWPNGRSNITAKDLSGVDHAANWGFDSPFVISQKAQGAINIGVNSLNVWDIRYDYFNASDLSYSSTQSSSRGQDNIVRSTRKALNASVRGTEIFSNVTPFAAYYGDIMQVYFAITAGDPGGKTYYWQFEERYTYPEGDPNAGLQIWKKADQAWFREPNFGSFQFEGASYIIGVAANQNLPPGLLYYRLALYGQQPPEYVPPTLVPLSTALGSIENVSNTTITLSFNPSVVNEGQSTQGTLQVTGTPLADNAPIYITIGGNGVTADYFSPPELEKTLYFSDAVTGSLQFPVQIANVVSSTVDAIFSVTLSSLSSFADVVAQTPLRIIKTSPGGFDAELDVLESWVVPGETITLTSQYLTEQPVYETLYYRLQGFDASAFLVNPSQIQGSFTYDSNGVAAPVEIALKSDLPNGAVYVATLYQNPDFTNPVNTPKSATILQTALNTDSDVSLLPASIGANQHTVYSVWDLSKNDGDVIWVKATGSAVDNNLITTSTTAQLTFTNSRATWILETTDDFPTTEPYYELIVTAYQDAAFTQPFAEWKPQYCMLNEVVANNYPKLNTVVTARNWSSHGGTGAGGTDSPTVSDMTPYLKQLDNFIFDTEATLYEDGNFYFYPVGDGDPWNPDNRVLDASATNWAPEISYERGSKTIKEVAQNLENTLVSSVNRIVRLGGPGYCETWAWFGVDSTSAAQFAYKTLHFTQLIGSKVTDFFYVLQNEYDDEVERIHRLFQALDSATRPNREFPQQSFNLTLQPTANGADNAKLLEIARKVAPYVQKITIATYQLPSDRGQDETTRNGQDAPVYNHTGVQQSVLNVTEFIGADIPPAKLGISGACYGYSANSPNLDPQTASKVSYRELATTQGAGDFPYGNFTNGDDPNQTTFGFDSTTTLAQKIQAARNMGLSHILLDDITSDYWGNAAAPGGNARADMALLRAARIGIDGGTVGPFTPTGVAFGVDNQWTLPGETLTFTALDVDSEKEGEGVYWELEGFNPADILDGDTSMSGTATVTNGAATFSKTVKGSISAGAVYKATIYEDFTKTKQLAPAVSATVLQTAQNNTPPYVTVSPAAATTYQLITYKLHLPDISDGTNIYLKATGSAVDNNLIVGSSSTTVQLQNSSAVWQFSTAGDFPALSPTYELKIDAYTDSGFTNQVPDTSTQYVTLHEANVTDEVKVGAYVDIYQWRNHDSNLVPGAPSPTVDDIGSDGFPQLDEFALLAEIQLYSDGKLYFSAYNPPVFDNNSLVLNGDASDWNPVDDVNAGPKLLKDANARIQPFNPRKYTISVGGYALSNYMTDAGSTDALATTSAEQLFQMATLSNAQAIDLDYEPLDGSGVAVALEPENMARICQKLREKIQLENSPLKITLTLVPSLDDADTLKRIATAVACESYVDRINVMTYDNPSYYGQTPLEDGTPFQNHTGVYQSVLDVVRFINAGVSPQKLGMGYALYGRLNSNPFGDAGTSYYDTVRGVSTGDFPLGRANYSGGWRGMDSTTTLTQKVMAARMLGLDYVFGWEITQDDWQGGGTGGNTRANMALTKAARLASYGFEIS